MVVVDLELVLHLDFAASLKVKADLKLIPAFELKCANFELSLKLELIVAAVSSVSPASGVAVSLAGLVAAIIGIIVVIEGIFVDSVLGTGLEGVIVVVNPVLVDVAAGVAIVGLKVGLVVGVVTIVDSILVDIGAHILVGASAVAGNTTMAALLTDITVVLVAFAAIMRGVSCATIATKALAEGMTTGTTTAIATIATVVTIAATSAMDTSLAVSCVEALEALTAVRGSANGAGVLIKVLGTTCTIVTVLAVELLGSTLTRFVASD